jgi:biotin carboxylase
MQREVPNPRVCVIHAYPNVYLLETLLKAGCRIVLVGPSSPVSKRFNLEAVIETPLHDNERIIKGVEEHHRLHPLDVLLPVYEGATLLTAQLAESLGIQGSGTTAALASRNKFIASNLWSEKGIPVPKTVPIFDPVMGYRKIEEHLGYPAVLKLSDSMNSQGVIKIENRSEYLEGIERLLKMLERPVDCDLTVDRNRLAYGRSDVKVIAQEYCPGLEVGVDLLVTENHRYVLGIFEKAPATGPCFAESMSVFPTSLGSSGEEAIGKIAIEAALTLGLKLGSAHVEIRFNSKGPCVLEAGLRPGGAYTVMATEFLTGVNIYTKLVELFLGKDPEIGRKSEKAALYGGVVYQKSGILKEVKGLEVLKDIPGIIDYQVLNHPGDPVFALPESAQPHFVYYLLGGDTREEVIENHQRIQRSIEITID